MRNNKPPTPNTGLNKTAPLLNSNSCGNNIGNAKPKFSTKLSVDQVFSASDSDKDKMMDSPALMSDSDDDVPSRPPTPSISQTASKPVAAVLTEESCCVKPVGATATTVPMVSLSAPPPSETGSGGSHVEKTAAVVAAAVKETNTSSSTADRTSRNLFDSSDEEEEYLPPGSKTKQDLDRHRRVSAHERQKENENLFDSLLTVNVDLVPGKISSRKSPGGALKSPGGCLKSPGLKQQPVSSGSRPSEPQKSPGSHRAPPLLSPGGKPTYLLAHFDKGANREAEKRHREQEKSLQRSNSIIATGKPAASDKRPTESSSWSKVAEVDVETNKESSAHLDIGTNDKQSEDIIELKTVAGCVEFDTSDIKILEEKIHVKAKISEVSPGGLKEKSHRLETKQLDHRLLTEARRRPSSDKGAAVVEAIVLDAEEPVPAENYTVFARGSLEAASSPSPASDYEEDRLVIRDEDETETSSDIEMESSSSSIIKKQGAGSISVTEEILVEQSDSSEVSILSETKVCRQSEPSREQQLEQSIASITSELETDSTTTPTTNSSSMSHKPDSAASAEVRSEEIIEQSTQTEVEMPVKQRTVISQEETESAVNALLGESFDSFDTEEPTVSTTVEVQEEEEPAASGVPAVDDEAAAAVAGLATEMAAPEEDLPARWRIAPILR